MIELSYHDELNPKIWNEYNRLDPEVRIHLDKIVDKFIEYLNIDKFTDVVDIVLTGSNCNYNWTKYSDIDLHILVDFDSLDCENCKIDADDCFKAKKSLWNDRHDITIRGHEIEVYVQDSSQLTVSDSGVYSLLDNDWITKPTKKENFKYNEILIKNKADNLAKQIIDILEDESEEQVDKIKEMNSKLANYRKSGLTKEGEFSLENLVFKTLRNRGLIDKLRNMQNKKEDDDLSLKESSSSFTFLLELNTK